jgi:hypothetical protein
MGYARFSGLFPVFPVNQGDTRKEAHARHATARPLPVDSVALEGKLPGFAWGCGRGRNGSLSVGSFKGNSRPVRSQATGSS